MITSTIVLPTEEEGLGRKLVVGQEEKEFRVSSF